MSTLVVAATFSILGVAAHRAIVRWSSRHVRTVPAWISEVIEDERTEWIDARERFFTEYLRGTLSPNKARFVEHCTGALMGIETVTDTLEERRHQ